MLFENVDDINFDKLKNSNVKIDRNIVMKFVKEAFQNTEKINFDRLIKIIKELN